MCNLGSACLQSQLRVCDPEYGDLQAAELKAKKASKLNKHWTIYTLEQLLKAEFHMRTLVKPYKYADWITEG